MGSSSFVDPHRQGSLDGLCGMYAIVNAMKTASGADASPEEIFQTACLALAPSRWPKVLWAGTVFADIRKMIGACIDMHGEERLRVRYPFQRTKASSNADFWSRLEEAFDDHNVTCAIIGIDKPHSHWLAIGLDGGRVQILDSDGPAQYDRKNRASLHAGLRRQKPGQWLVSRTDVALFCRVSQT